ncbi:MAG: DEAD/DEAH box helicase [Kofleriaceae bacterium]
MTARAPGAFSPATAAWFASTFPAPTQAQAGAWPALANGDHVLLVAPTGSGKTLAAFLAAIDRLLFAPRPPAPGRHPGTRILYVSPIKALAVDVERNLMAPLAGITAAAHAAGLTPHPVTVAVRSGDTTTKERRAIARGAADILITTPESLYLMLTSAARDALRTVETVIVDEIHALVPGERGAHLALSLERLDHLTGREVQRVGLSATQRPLDEVARFLAGARPVTLVDAAAPKALELTIEMPFAPGADGPPPDATDAADAAPASNWDRVFPRLLELIRAHTSTLVFVNSRRLAERAAAALNELAGEVLVHAHHGSVAKEQRAAIETALKDGALRGLVATSSLELGIDMGAIDLVVQVEPPQSVASGLQRVGRAGHQVGAASRGVIMSKHRGDVLACATLAAAMRAGAVERIRYQRNPLDVLAQQVVAMAAIEPWSVDAMYALIRRAGCFAELPRGSFDAVLDMLSGLYPIDELAELRPRLTYDRAAGVVRARDGAHRVAIASGGTIADRGLYGVYLTGAPAGKGRVGELDEEMVFESRVGDRFLLGASTWRIDEITHDRVLVSPAPGQPGKMPFWRGESAMRPYELGQRIGALARELSAIPPAAAHDRLVGELALAPAAAEVLLGELAGQAAASTVPTDRTVVIEVSPDELGDLRVCVLAPFGARVMAPWAMLAQHAARARLGFEVELLWTNDGFAIRLPEGTSLDGLEAWLVPAPATVRDQLTALVADTSMFAARFREAAGRALLLPRRRPGQRTPLWQVRKKAQDLLRGAQQVADFPILLEAYRKCLADVFDLTALTEVLGGVATGAITLARHATTAPSPFASAVLFGYVASFMYEGDAPPLERRAAALAIDPARLRELVGDVSLRDLLDAEVLAEVEASLGGHAEVPDGADRWHDRLLRCGDVDATAIDATTCAALIAAGRALALGVGPRTLVVPVEYAARYRDALGVALPAQLPAAYRAPTADPVRELVVRYARTHGPFTVDDLAARYQLAAATLAPVLAALAAAGVLVEGEFRPGGTGREWLHADVLRTLRSRSLARVRRQIAPVPATAYVRFLHAWHGVVQPRAGLDAVLDAVERLQGLPVLASQLEAELLPARVADYAPGDLDTLAAAGEVVWHGVAAAGERDGRVAVYLADQAAQFVDGTAQAAARAAASDVGGRLLELLSARGALFFTEIRAALPMFPGDLVRALWALVWAGLCTNDSFHPLRELAGGATASRRRPQRRPVSRAGFRSRRAVPPAAEGRWALVPAPTGSPTDRAHAQLRQWLTRYGVVTKDSATAEGGFAAAYPVLRALEDSGQLVRGHFVAELAAMQFATASAVEALRSHARPRRPPAVVTLDATDCANPYGAILPWPAGVDGEARPRRVAGATVVTVDGAAVAWLPRDLAAGTVWPAADADAAASTAHALVDLVRAARASGEPAVLVTLDGRPAAAHPLAPALLAAGLAARGTTLVLARAAL